MLKTLTFAEQVAVHLREELKRGRWTESMPGRDRLASELGVNSVTVERALKMLEREGVLKSQGVGRRRRINLSENLVQPSMRVSTIFYEPEEPAIIRYILELRDGLHGTGHDLDFAPETLVDLKMNPNRIAKMVRSHPADAWIILSGSKPVLEWFSKAPVPAFALFGRMQDLPIPGIRPNKLSAEREAVRFLISKGHKRIVKLTREERRKPNYGPGEQMLLDELEAHGISAGSFNLPDWEESAQGLHRCLEQLFQVTPPSAILVDDGMLFLGVRNYMALQQDPNMRKVVLMCTDHHPAFDWCVPPVPHIQWDYKPIIRRMVRWVNNVARGKEDLKQSVVKARFIRADLI
jgi:DNA-binding LacI/PurR family transcriptional regulator